MDFESDNERSRSLKPHREDTPWSGSSNDSNLHLDSENNTSGSSSRDYLSKNSKTTIHAFNIVSPDENFRALPSSTSSSLATSSGGLFQVLPTAPIKPRMNVYCSDRLENQSEASSTDYVSGDSSVKSDELEYKSMGSTSTSTVSDITHKSAVSTRSLIQPPPAQVMDRSGGTEPYGIPSSVFASSKSSTPVEWSLSSNDSLFSIQIGNSSFSREHVIMSGGNPPKPNELPPSTLESIPFRPQSQGQAVVAAPDDINELEMVFTANQRTVGFAQENDDRQIKEKTATDTMGPAKPSRHPDGSWTSAKTISCPVEKKSECQKPTHTSWMRKMFCGSKSSCCISNCSWASCCCCKCPSCSCLSCGSCTFCYGGRKRVCCSHTLTEVGGSNPIEIDNQKYREQLQSHHQNAQKPSHTPTSRSSSNGSCGSCGSCGSRGPCCSLQSCCSWWSCCSWRSCCSWWSCCSLRSSCSRWSCCSLRSCSSCCSCFSCRTCCSCWSCCSCCSCSSCRTCCSRWSCSSCFPCSPCHSCCSCSCCCSSFSCQS